MTQDKTEKRRMVLTAAAHTIATACRHLYEEQINAAKEAGDVLAVVRLKVELKRDYTEWTAPIFAAMDVLDKPPLIIMPVADPIGR